MENEKDKVLEIIEVFSRKLPKFKDGRIDYSESDTAPVITVFLKYKDKILLLKRSKNVRAYKNKWSTVVGYLDELKPLKLKALEELQEELGIDKNIILSIKTGESYEFTDGRINKTWIKHPLLVELKEEPKIRLDWEHTEYKWIIPEELEDFDIIPNLKESFKRIIK